MSSLILLDTYEAAKAGTNLTEQRILAERLLATIPDWFNAETGFKFLSGGGCPCVVIGVGGWRDIKSVPLKLGEQVIGAAWQQLFQEPGILYAWRYKGEWHIDDLMTKDDDWWKSIRPWEGA